MVDHKPTVTERLLEWLTRLFVFGWEILLLPSSARRLARINIDNKVAAHAFREPLRVELAVLKETVDVASQMERELQEMDLALQSSRQTVVAEWLAGVARLRRRFTGQGEQDEPPAPSPKSTGNPPPLPRDGAAEEPTYASTADPAAPGRW